MRALAGQPVRPYRLGAVNCNSTLKLLLTSLDFDGEPFIPTTMQYRIDDLESGQGVLQWTTIVAPEAYQEITITPQQNTMLFQYRDSELRQLTVAITDENGAQQISLFLFEVVNLLLQSLPT